MFSPVLFVNIVINNICVPSVISFILHWSCLESTHLWFACFVSCYHTLCFSQQQIINQILNVFNQSEVLLPFLFYDVNFYLVNRPIWGDFRWTWVVFTLQNYLRLFLVFIFSFILKRNITLFIIPFVTIFGFVILFFHHLLKVEFTTLSEILITNWGFWLDHRIIFEIVSVSVC
jgi:hypothetical protein